jgi:hypothetical protein
MIKPQVISIMHSMSISRDQLQVSTSPTLRLTAASTIIGLSRHHCTKPLGFCFDSPYSCTSHCIWLSRSSMLMYSFLSLE